MKAASAEIPVEVPLASPQPSCAASVPSADLTCNEVVLRGRVAAPPEERELPSGDSLLTVRLIVDRDATARSRSSQRVDTIDCVAWGARVQRTLRSWATGDTVHVDGSIRRRFFRGDSGAVSRVEVEVKRARRLKKSSSPEGSRARTTPRRRTDA